jgi:glycosyltransferase XagB
MKTYTTSGYVSPCNPVQTHEHWGCVLGLATPRFGSVFLRACALKARFLVLGGVIVVLSIGGGTASAQAPRTGNLGRSDAQPVAPIRQTRAVHRAPDWSARPVARWSGYSTKGGSERVRDVQVSLRALGYPPGPIDGLFGPRTEQAVLRFQRAQGLQPDGIVGPYTLRRLRSPRGGSERVREVQLRLNALGYPPGPVDGLFGPRTERAVLRFQRAQALRPDGIVGPNTLRRLRSLSGRLRRLARGPGRRTRPPRRRPAKPRSQRPPGPTSQREPAPGTTRVPGPGPSPGPVERTEPGPGSPWPVVIVVLGVLGFLLVGAAVAGRARTRGRAAPSASSLGPFLGPAARPAPPADQGSARSTSPASDRLGDLLRDAGALTDADLAAALREQQRTGGRLHEILAASGVVPTATLTKARARQLGVDTLRAADEPVPLLSPHEARTWRAVALNGSSKERAVAVADPTDDLLASLAARLAGPVEPRLCDEGTIDELLIRVYANVDAEEVTRSLREEAPDLSAYRSTLSRAQILVACVLTSGLAIGLLVELGLTATVLVVLATAFFVLSTGFRLYAARQGSRPGATIEPPGDALAAIDERTLPVYTILLPLYKEKPATIGDLFDALSHIDYPKHKLDGLLLIEADDDSTREAIEEVGRPAWIRVLPLPPGLPRTKPRAMAIGLRYARGSFVTVYDAEDKPDPTQLKKAVWVLERADESLACLQAKLDYYNPRQNLLTRWFTLEYDAWFNIFLPGLHRIGAPIPLGGTSNHFRRAALDACLAWDPYNVTEDADLGLRLARLGLTTAMLESTTAEEANSRIPNWLRQRSRWSKGFMQTLLVHTRRPLTLFRELGVKGALGFLLTVGGTVATALLSPIFWTLLVLWIYTQPAWVAELFPGPIYYLASLSLLLGNFLLVFLSLCVAVSRGHDDLAPHALLTPLYWVLMSVATYIALVELIVRPYHWHKTEHGLHLAHEPASTA